MQASRKVIARAVPLGRQLIAVLPALLFTHASFSAEAQPQQLAAIEFADASYFFQVIVSLGIVLAVIFLLSAVARKFELTAPQSEGPVRVLDSLNIGGKEQLLLVQVGEDQILVGRSAGRVDKIHTLTSPVSQSEKVSAPYGAAGFLSRVLNR